MSMGSGNGNENGNGNGNMGMFPNISILFPYGDMGITRNMELENGKLEWETNMKMGMEIKILKQHENNMKIMCRNM